MLCARGRLAALAFLLAAASAGCGKPPPPVRTDQEIRASVINALMSDPATLNARGVWLNNVSARSGVVTLAGTVPDEKTRGECERVARAAAGSATLVNNIRVQAPPPSRGRRLR